MGNEIQGSEVFRFGRETSLGWGIEREEFNMKIMKHGELRVRLKKGGLDGKKVLLCSPFEQI